MFHSKARWVVHVWNVLACYWSNRGFLCCVLVPLVKVSNPRSDLRLAGFMSQVTPPPRPLLDYSKTAILVIGQHLKHKEDELIRANNSDFSKPLLNSFIKASVSLAFYKRCVRLLEKWGIEMYVWSNSKAWILVNCLFSSPWELLALKLNNCPPAFFFLFFFFVMGIYCTLQFLKRLLARV